MDGSPRKPVKHTFYFVQVEDSMASEPGMVAVTCNPTPWKAEELGA